jgi:GNAT superfamily N-acetyltransferase
MPLRKRDILTEFGGLAHASPQFLSHSRPVSGRVTLPPNFCPGLGAAMAVTFRFANLDDVQTIAEFQIAMARETEEVRLDPGICTAGVRGLFDDPAFGRYHVAEIGDVVVGSTLVTYEWSDWRNGVVWWIQSVYVKPEFRRRGVYSGLYARIRGLAEADPKVRGIRLYVDRRNVPAQQVYERLGMNGDHYQVFEWMK